MAIFSFHPVKTIAAGEGGAVTTNDPALARRLRRLRSHGMTHEPGDFANRIWRSTMPAPPIPGTTRCRRSAGITGSPTSMPPWR
ncbi:MAG: DegT/DnrJ/EryC1/StrS family aminotransferase [Aliidongia sp.]